MPESQLTNRPSKGLMDLETLEAKSTVLHSPVSAPELVPFAKLGKQPVTGVDQGFLKTPD